MEQELITLNPVNHRVTIKDVTQDIHISIYQIAQAILNLNSEQQAELISYIAEDVTYDVDMRLGWIKDSDWLSEEGSQLMHKMGQYSNELT
jgi:hypothetical protein